VHELYGSDEVREAVTARWGAEVAPNLVVDRTEVARRAFASPEERAWLEGLLWPLVGAHVAAWREGLEDADPRPRAAVVETPLLFEAGLEGGYDATIAVIADEDVTGSTSGPPGNSARRRRRPGRRTWSQTAGLSNSWSLRWPTSLRS
jgi:dephospho-CoA kinase